MTQTLRDYQQAAVDHAVAWYFSVHEAFDATNNRKLYYGPTGSGKGTIELALLNALRAAGVDAILLSPSLEIIRGFLDRAGIVTSNPRRAAEELGIMTPVRFRNRLRKTGEIPDCLIVDEAHEFTDSNLLPAEIMATLGSIPIIGFTATPYRGTNKGTLEFQRLWGPAVEILSMKDAVARGFITFPQFKIEPLVDDDKIEITAGDFDASATAAAYKASIEDLAALVARYRDRPTIVSVPNVAIAEALAAAVPGSFAITQSTSESERLAAYEASRLFLAPIIQVSVLTRGADLPWLEVLIDAQPTQSPVRFMQTVGRIMRPKERQALVVVTNRNLERHSVLLTGFLPLGKSRESQTAFGSPSRRAASRDLGLAGFDRLKSLHLPLRSGGWATCLRLYASSEDGSVTDYCLITVPGSMASLWATRRKVPRPGAQYHWQYEKWRRCAPPDDIEALATTQPRARDLSEKQAAVWEKSAERLGLSRAPVGVGSREFDAFYALLEMGVAIK